MTASAITPRDMSTSTTGRNNYPVVWLIALAVFALLWLAPVPGWIDVYPKAWEIPAAGWISAAMK